MPALETLARVAEQKRSGRHQLAAVGRPVLKGARSDDSDREAGMLFFERAVSGTGSTNNIPNSPPVAFSQKPRGSLADPTVQSAPSQSLL
jgi:hypothetical protein